jgi:hypothetical protein
MRTIRIASFFVFAAAALAACSESQESPVSSGSGGAGGGQNPAAGGSNVVGTGGDATGSGGVHGAGGLESSGGAIGSGGAGGNVQGSGGATIAAGAGGSVPGSGGDVADGSLGTGGAEAGGNIGAGGTDTGGAQGTGGVASGGDTGAGGVASGGDAGTGGSCVLDDCGICDGYNASKDCLGVCGGTTNPVYYQDADGDGFGNPAVSSKCTQPAGYITTGGDCNDKLYGCTTDCTACSSSGTVRGYVYVTTGKGGFTPTLAAGDQFGAALANIGDIDGNGVADLAVGAPGDDTGGTNRGAVWILRMGANGTVIGSNRIAHVAATNALGDYDAFGSSLAAIGDLDGDKRSELAVGVPGREGATASDLDRGAVAILFLNSTGTLKSRKLVDAVSITSLANYDDFGKSVAAASDLDGDGTPDLLVGAPGDSTLASSAGNVWSVHLTATGGVKSATRLGSQFPANRFEGTYGLGTSLAALGDVDGNGHGDFAVCGDGVPGALFMGSGDTIASTGEMLGTPMGFNCRALGGIGDLDRDGVPDAALGWKNSSVLISTLTKPGPAKNNVQIDASTWNLAGAIGSFASFGASVAMLPDFDKNGVASLGVGAPDAPAGGAVWIVQLGVECAPGFGDCNATEADGCETDVTSNAADCGACGVTCTGRPHTSGGTCSAGKCQLSCAVGYADCNGDPSDGCEVNTKTDPANCNSCKHQCTAGGFETTPSCSAGVCGLVCASPNYGDCNANLASDGCETNLLTDSANCGACANPCGASQTCSGGTCSSGTCGSASDTCCGCACAACATWLGQFCTPSGSDYVCQ